MQNELPKRKYPRLNDYDYGSAGAYFVTICTQNRACLLSRVVGDEYSGNVEYTKFGKIAEQQLLSLENKYPCLKIDQYVIMPNHIHILFVVEDKTYPAITGVVGAYKSLTTKECNKNGHFGKLFQRSFFEHIIRGREDYEETAKYIFENPTRWYFDELYKEDM